MSEGVREEVREGGRGGREGGGKREGGKGGREEEGGRKGEKGAITSILYLLYNCRPKTL